MLTRFVQLGFVFITIFLLLPAPVLGGSANDPEILSRPNTSAQLRGEVIPHLEITKGWVHAEKGGEVDRFQFILEIASLPPEHDLPKDAVYVFHYTVQEAGRLYFRANWSADQSELEFFGGMYAGCRPPACAIDQSYDGQGNRNYIYMPPADRSQFDALETKLIPGAPGRIVWSYPMESYRPTERLDGFELKGLFAATYTQNQDGALRYADIALSVKDYQYTVNTPWSEKLFAQLPGVSPMIIVIGVSGLIATMARRLRGGDEDEEPTR